MAVGEACTSLKFQSRRPTHAAYSLQPSQTTNHFTRGRPSASAQTTAKRNEEQLWPARIFPNRTSSPG
jgi:hypothetical protein